MTLFPPIMSGVMNTQKMSYAKHSGSSMQATCMTAAFVKALSLPVLLQQESWMQMAFSHTWTLRRLRQAHGRLI